MHLTDPQTEAGEITALRVALRQSRGPGNFKNLFVHSPSGSMDVLKLIPVSEVANKVEFTGIKERDAR